MQLKKYGGYVRLCEDYHGEPWLTLGPDRCFCIMFMLMVNGISLLLLLILNKSETGYTFFIVHIVILIFLDLTWVAAGVINPGLVVRWDDDDDQCPRCLNNDEQIADFTNFNSSITHCNQCEICIKDREHHCKILGTCIGKNNKIVYYFYLLGMVLWVIDVASTAPYAYYMI